MYLILAVLIGFVIGLVRRGSLASLFAHKYRFYLLGVLGTIILVLLHFTYRFSLLNPYLGYFPIVGFVGYLLILVMLTFNLEDLYTIAIAVGVTLNFIVAFLNGGYLPVSGTVLGLLTQYSELAQSVMMGTNGFYSLMTPATMLSFFSVLIPLPVFPELVGFTGFVPGFSVGSCFLYLGLIGAVQKAMILDRGKKQRIIETVVQTPQPKFHSKTEELFFEDVPLPENPLDAMFQESSEPPKPVAQHDELSEALEELTIPLAKLVQEEGFSEDFETAEFTEIDWPQKGEIFKPGLKYERSEEDKADIRMPVTETIDEIAYEPEPTRTFVAENRQEEAPTTEKPEPEPAVEETEPSEKQEPTVVEAKTERESEEIPAPSEQTPEVEKPEPTVEKSSVPEEKPVEPTLEEKPKPDISFYKTEKPVGSGKSPVPEEEKAGETAKTEQTKVTASPPEPPVENKDESGTALEPEQVLEESPVSQNTMDLITQMMNEDDYKELNDDFNAYIEAEKATLDDSVPTTRDEMEEEMMDIWAKVAQENLNRKLGRKRQASANYKTNNPYREEMEKREQEEGKRRDALFKQEQQNLSKERDRFRDEQDQMARTINAQTETMTDQQRREAGYEQVEYDINGRKIKFWRKKNES